MELDADDDHHKFIYLDQHTHTFIQQDNMTCVNIHTLSSQVACYLYAFWAIRVYACMSTPLTSASFRVSVHTVKSPVINAINPSDG